MPADETWSRIVGSPAIRAAVDRIIPADDWPAGWDGGVAGYLHRAAGQLVWAAPALSRLRTRLGDGFPGLTADEQDAILQDLDARPQAGADLAVLRRLCWEGYYAESELPGDGGRHRPAGLTMIGFRGVPADAQVREPVLPCPTDPARIRQHYDAIVIGSGPGGGVAAQVLAEAGHSVLIVERARNLDNRALRGDHLHGKRDAVYDSVVGPGAGHPRIAVHASPDAGDPDIVEETLIDGDEDAWHYGLNAYAYGGGTRIWQGMAWRFFPEDFAMASHYGNPAGATLADWPVGYDEMEPYYSRAEAELGVAGAEGALTRRTPRTRGYPMPPMGDEPARALLAGAADRLGWGWGPIPLAINSVPHDGRPACVRCSQCVGHACPVDAKNGAHNTFVPRALATGRTDIVFDTEAVEVGDGPGGASVQLITDCTGTPAARAVRADVVVVSAGAIETPRLLLASGLGNDQLGRHLHDHRFVTVQSTVDRPVKNGLGPGHSIATLDHAHAGTIPWGGGVLVDQMSVLPLAGASRPSMPGVPGWGLGHKRWMRTGRPYAFGVFGMGQEVPSATSGVSLAGHVRDRWGRPAARLRKDVHPASVQVEAGLASYACRWLEVAGGHDIRRQPPGPTASAAGEHSCGTARMSADPAGGATDPYGRLWGARRVVVCDSSLHPTNGSVNPTLTIVANAYRVADRLVRDWPA